MSHIEYPGQVNVVSVEWYPKKPKRVVLDLNGELYDALIQCLEAHSVNHIFGESGVRLVNARVLNCVTARKVLDKIQAAVNATA